MVLQSIAISTRLERCWLGSTAETHHINLRYYYIKLNYAMVAAAMVAVLVLAALLPPPFSLNYSLFAVNSQFALHADLYDTCIRAIRDWNKGW
jgi:hypothetical protein